MPRGGRGCLVRAELPQSPSCCLPFTPAIRAPASTLPACANTETHLNKLRRHNKSKGNEGLCLGAGESLEFNYIGKPLATEARRVPHAASADVQERAQLHGRAGGTAPKPVPGTAPVPPSHESETRACRDGSRALATRGPPAVCARMSRHTAKALARGHWQLLWSRWQRPVPQGSCCGSVQSPACPCQPRRATRGHQARLRLGEKQRHRQHPSAAARDLQPVPRCLKTLAHGCGGDSRKSLV